MRPRPVSTLFPYTTLFRSGVAMGISVQTDMATPALARFGSDELKRRYLTPAIRGEQVGAIAVTEPGAGSDVAGIKTRAVRHGDRSEEHTSELQSRSDLVCR